MGSIIEKAVTVYPVTQPVHMYQLHQYALESSYNKLIQDASLAMNRLQMTTSKLEHSASKYKRQWWLWYKAHTNPKSRYDLYTWQYFNSSTLCQLHEHQPCVNIPYKLKMKLNTALDVTIKNTNDTNKNNLPNNIVDGFMNVDEASGMEFILRSSSATSSFVSHVLFPFEGPAISSMVKPFSKLTKIPVHIIVPVQRRHSLPLFLEFFETECLKDGAIKLHLVFFHHDEPMTVKIRQIQHIYPQAHIQIHEIKSHMYSPFFAYDHVAKKLSKSDLMIFFDMNFHFSLQFIDHCRMNAISGRQAYSPILFAFYKPDLVKKYTSQPQAALVTSDTGFFLRYNYQITAIYQTDYISLGGYLHLHGSASDEMKFVEKLINSDIYLMRALEPYLMKRFRAKSCKALKGRAKTSCMNSMVDSVGSKRVLGSLVINRDLL